MVRLYRRRDGAWKTLAVPPRLPGASQPQTSQRVPQDTLTL